MVKFESKRIARWFRVCPCYGSKHTFYCEAISCVVDMKVIKKYLVSTNDELHELLSVPWKCWTTLYAAVLI